MKTINVTFTEQEYKLLLNKKGKISWHDFILNLSNGSKNEHS